MSLDTASRNETSMMPSGQTAAMLTVEPFELGRHEEEWDALVSAAPMGTFLHSRRFLSYHGDRFIDRSMMLRNEKGQLLGVFPAAQSPSESTVVVSHPGSTYGGVVHTGGLKGDKMIAALSALCEVYQDFGYEKLTYKAVPWCYSLPPLCDDVYALFRVGAVKTRCDLSATIDVTARLPISERRRRALKTAHKSGLSVVVNELSHYEGYWELLTQNLSERHGARPVHSLAEILMLAERFPEDIRLMTAVRDGQIMAGVVLFESRQVVHAQYIGASPDAREIQALDYVFEHAVNYTRDAGKRYFDFGISTEDQGRLLNAGLYQFKSEFGAGGVVHDFYDCPLGLTRST